MATHSCSCLENPRDGGAWWAAVWGRTESDTTEATAAAAAAFVVMKKYLKRNLFKYLNTNSLIFIHSGGNFFLLM